MAGRTTALLVLGDYSVGPFQVREWKARHVVALVEKHRRAWMVAPIAHAAGEEIPEAAIYLPRGWTVAEEAVFVAAACAVREPSFMQELDQLGLIIDTSGFSDAERWLNIKEEDLIRENTLPSSLIGLAIESLRNVARIGLVRLEENSSFDDHALLWLRSQGLDIDDFRRQSLGN